MSPKKMGFFQKIKLELTIITIVILGIIAFFIYAKVVSVQSADQIKQQTILTQQIVNEIAGIRYEMGKNNCLLAANGDEELIEACRGAVK